ncbi:MAG: amidohydrolase [Eubacterium sp.]|nr:amidohydrolase [Eubacterium sp.]
MHIIDFHTHPYLSYDEDTCMYKECFYLPPEEMEEDIRRAGIGHICGSVISNVPYDRTQGFEPLRLFNRHALELRGKRKGFYTPGFHVHPAFVEESLKEIEFMHSQGVRLIGELVPYMHGWAAFGMDYGSRALREILELVGEYGMIVSFHTMPEWREQTEAMIAQNPKVRFVAAHPGQKKDYGLHLERMQKYGNLFLDLSGTGLFRYGMLAAGVQKVGSERLIFGTDYPITNPGMYVQAVLFERISERDRENIFYRNAEKLLGIGAGVQESSPGGSS